MTYSRALWEEGDTLEQAQRRKLRAICEKLRLHPGDHVLEIGCGWGSFALMAAGEYGARVTGITSPSASSSWRPRACRGGRTRRSRRDPAPGTTVRSTDGYSKIASIEMLEAVGYAQYPTYFAACDRLLDPGGLAACR